MTTPVPPPAAPPGPITAPPPSVPAAPSTTAPAPTTPPRARTASPKNPRWERIRRWLKPPRRLRTTRDGRFFLLLTVAVGLAAINTGNNLLYLLLGMLLALIVVSGIMSELSLRRLTVVRRLPARAQVGRPHLVEIEVHNHKKRVPSYAIEIEDLREGQPADKRCFFLKISPGAVQVAAYRRTPARRGLDRHVGFRVATRFPFGLFEKSRELTAEGELVTYPAVDPVKLPPLTAGPRGGGNASPGRGIGDEILGVRPMREGDDPRDIYWRKSALMGQMVLRERARDTQRNVSLLLDAHHPGERPDDAWLAQFERRIRDVASRAVAHLRRGDQVIVTASTGARVRADRSVGADPLLRMLALLEAEPAPARP
ncbi:MAG: DUF58 domain-containing protein, partial [Deltaproteobacteria bacterium]|nr:DUF58 domain-containing protein [Deltaproteobacteria bacterium]